MPSTERIIFQPYKWGSPKRGRTQLEPGTPIVCRSVEEGRRRADKVAVGGTSIDGAVLVRMFVDEEAGDYGEPEILVSVGDVPDIEE
ncbi:hypothetical protein CFR75_14830 [Komagataeibacter xylinus]|uniref:Uncharacterized protein n=1 Tax=Komagataeibacter xylinus TaxID=28448 RepID=A0A318PYL9_KOMXY|nr:hypothetical protein [Komagataeibacter xylinus]PYD55727.1 hypothetical protein CFR75_14830 [Komagataeibacter xylinus]GBQ75348.1 hypothetical protein AA15237_2065 [Komagataeibacter xylinus NBRC 15237]